jgi:hypothetical protein
MTGRADLFGAGAHFSIKPSNHRRAKPSGDVITSRYARSVERVEAPTTP